MSDGPDLTSYEWHFLTRYPPRELKYPRYIDGFRKIIRESAEAHPGFTDKLRQVALFAINQAAPKLIRQGLQCLAHVGLPEDIPLLKSVESRHEALIAKEAATCIFEISKHPRAFEAP